MTKPDDAIETHTIEQRLDFLEADSAAQRRAIVALEKQVDPVRLDLIQSVSSSHTQAIINICRRVESLEIVSKMVDWTVPILIGAVLSLAWFVLTK
jgi:hypothetical protein